MLVKYFYITMWDNFGMEIGKIVGENLKQARKSLKLTQKEVAAHMLMTQQQYSRFENGVFELNYAQIVELCRYLDVTPNDLFEFKG